VKRIIALAVVALLACACSGLQVSSDPTSSLVASNQKLVSDLQATAYNLDQAVAVGALPAGDPAQACVHDVLQKVGVEGGTPPKSFTPKLTGLASAGSVAYIFAQQAKALRAAGFQVDPACEQLVGRIVIDGAKTTAAASPLALVPIPH
jgi:hypothetical protein